MHSKLLTQFLFQTFLTTTVVAHVFLDLNDRNLAFDPDIYEGALDPELCSQQLHYITRFNNTILQLRFLEAGMRLPRAILELNNLDMGNYEQCIGIYQEIADSTIEGKYCMIQGPINQNFVDVAEAMGWSEFDPEFLSEENLQNLQKIEKMESQLKSVRSGFPSSRSIPGESTLIPTFRMALCIPKTCTTQEGMRGLLFNLTQLGFSYEEEFCRFNGDKLWAPADYVAIVLLSVFGFITLLSTAYDIYHLFILQTDPKSINTLLRSFSVFTNGKRLTTFSSQPSNLHCVDGIRAISMFWIIVGHTYVMLAPTYNLSKVLEWITSLGSLWITTAPYSVDTFFFLSGLLVVYTTVGKLTSVKLLKSLHLFYLNRLLRMFPLLATIVLLQASIFHHLTDGPFWGSVADNVDNCRTYWWTTLLYIQNYVAVDRMCINHSWYLAIDMHCYIVSPLILYWVLSGKKTYAWSALSAGLLAALVAGTTYSFINKFPGWVLVADRPGGNENYQRYYYYNTITRASPFFVGMIFGYLLNIWKGQQPKLSYIIACLLWMISMGTLFVLMYLTHLMRDATWDSFVVDDLVNSFGRPIWAVAIGWVIFACQYGYGGPINWFLSLDIWKLPSRISYAMYLFHFHLQYIRQGAALQPIYFSDAYALGVFIQDAVIAYAVGFFMTLLIDSPFSVLFKIIFGEGPKKPRKELKENEVASQ